jgi:cytochrome c556
MMKFLTRAAGVMAIVALQAALPVHVARADNQDDISYRQAVMKTLGEQAASIQMIVQGKAPAENMAVHAQILSITANAALAAFTPKVAGGESKADVWAKWDDFSKKVKEFQVAADDLAKTAKAGGADAAKAKLQATFSGCKGCHDIYREHKQ